MAFSCSTLRRCRLGWLAIPVLLVALTSAARAEGKKMALLIGVDNYPEGSGFTSLRYTERDVEQLAEVLLASGYRPEHVRVLSRQRSNENTRFYPSLRNARREIRLLAQDRKPEDTLLIALSGHGVTRRVGGKAAAFFAPIDVELSEPETLLPLDELYATLEGSRAGTKVLLVDACRDDPTEGRAAAIPFAPEPAPASIAALFACSDGEVAWDAAELGGGHGVFFHFVIEGLKGDADTSSGNRDGKVSLAELLAYTQDKVPDYVSARRGRRQMPILLGNTGRITLLDRSGSRAGDVITSQTTGMRLKLVPAGSFLMGALKEDDKDAHDDEAPRHRVRISRPFYLGTTEVTVGQFRRVVEAAGYRTEAERDGKGGTGWSQAARVFQQEPRFSWRNPGFPQTDDHPVTNVSWHDAIAYCNALSEQEGLRPCYHVDGSQVTLGDGDGYRLPTEAEWEYAGRAGVTTRYQGGDDPASLVAVANVSDASARASYPGWRSVSGEVTGEDGFVFTAPVGKFRPNAFGLFDMQGNLWEWCWDGYQKDFYRTSPDTDPVGPSRAAERIARGGSFIESVAGSRLAFRLNTHPTRRDSLVGFRVARSRSR